jgi:hypothetical protein
MHPSEHGAKQVALAFSASHIARVKGHDHSIDEVLLSSFTEGRHGSGNSRGRGTAHELGREGYTSIANAGTRIDIGTLYTGSNISTMATAAAVVTALAVGHRY